MAEPTSVTRVLGRELRALRTLAGTTQRGIAGEVAVSQSTVQRAEVGQQLLRRAEVERWLDATAATDDVRERLLALTEAAHGGVRSWDAMLEAEPVRHLQLVAARRETAVRLSRDCCLTWIPGLLQTAEYARQVIAQTAPPGVFDHAGALAARLERQQVLYREGCRFEFLIAEDVLRWRAGADVMLPQLDRMGSLATLANVEIAVLPASREGAVAWHSFIYREPTDERESPFVTVELLHGGQVVADETAVAAYAALWERLWKAAAHGDEATDLIRAAATTGR